MKERRFVKQLPSTSLNRAKCNKLNKSVKNSANEDEDRWALGVASKFECAASVGNQREVWANKRVLSQKPKKRTSAVRDKEVLHH